jgi:hypothetical protein
MPDFSRFSAFARKVGAVASACSTCSTVAHGAVLQVSDSNNKAVEPVALVAHKNSVAVNENRLRDAVEEVFHEYYALDDPMNPDAWR